MDDDLITILFISTHTHGYLGMIDDLIIFLFDSITNSNSVDEGFYIYRGGREAHK